MQQQTGRQQQTTETNCNTNTQWCKGYSTCQNLQESTGINIYMEYYIHGVNI